MFDSIICLLSAPTDGHVYDVRKLLDQTSAKFRCKVSPKSVRNLLFLSQEKIEWKYEGLSFMYIVLKSV